MTPGAFGSETTKIGIAGRIARRVVDRVAPAARRAAFSTAGGPRRWRGFKSDYLRSLQVRVLAVHHVRLRGTHSMVGCSI